MALVITNLFFAILGLFLIVYVYNRVKKNLFSEKESIFWMLGAVMVFVLSVFPKIIDFFSNILGISYPPSLLFLITMIFTLFLLFRQSQQITLINDRFKELVQKNAILDQKVREISERLNNAN
ncbi:hypothetical protein SAMN04487897_102600 [Paenibacillus sp. yr247]|uniref:DUF2304 domain-containing protein n=1 Tax=Paenibacillus sp. yr247 TaxID=1761880 RepID=UPI0008910159|nr:DUF2304 domain-containing protein [Paenibacillus sp. yr247]SDN35020.1 hypothetical protein SAMN04487897_102600 [Paenibacillus sp. yr247]